MHIADYAVIGLYFAAILYIGLRTRKSIHSSDDSFLSGRSLPVAITGFAFVAANMGSFALMGASATAAKYGMFATQLSWIGCVPAMIFSGLVMARFFYGSKARSVPEYPRMRFDEKTRALNAINFAFLTIFTSGLSLYGLAVVFQALFHWNIHFSIWISACTVLVYVYWGGLRVSIYAEVLQFVLIVVGTAPLSIMVLRSLGGFSGLLARLPENMSHTWTPVLNPEGTAYGAGLFSVVIGMGVASFAYWSTDFLVVQRVLAAKDMDTARKTPLFAVFPRMLLPFFTVIPGLAALIVIPRQLEGNFNLALPLMFLHYYPAGLLGVGVAAAGAAEEDREVVVDELAAAAGQDRRTTLTLPNGIVGTYTYDTASRLTGIAYASGTTPTGDLVYSYDPGGRRAGLTGSMARTGLPTALTSATYNANNQLTQWGAGTITYDLNGNLLGDGVNNYTWNPRKQLATITAVQGGATIGTFQYDAFGRRQTKTVAGIPTSFLYDGANPVQELSGATPTANLLTGGIDEFFTRTDAAGSRNFLADALGSTLALADSAGAHQTQYTYEPFGAASATGRAESAAETEAARTLVAE